MSASPMGADPPSVFRAPKEDMAALPAPNAFGVRLNAQWRVRDDGAAQWILELRHSKPGKAEKWSGRRYHVERAALLRSINELCGPVDPSHLSAIAVWPKAYQARGAGTMNHGAVT
jgi:hypothetical protein